MELDRPQPAGGDNYGIWTAFFWNLALADEAFQLGPGLRFRRATVTEQATLADDEVHQEVSRELAIMHDRFSPETRAKFVALESGPCAVLEYQREFFAEDIERTIGFPMGANAEAQAKITAVLLGLRLLSRTAVWLRQVRIYSIDPTFAGHNDGSPVLIYPQLSRTSLDILSPYSLTPDIVSDLRTMLPALVRTEQHPRLRLPLARFDDAYLRKKPVDAFVDHWVALESMFTTPDQRGELKATFRAAISFYICRNEFKRAAMRERISQSYNLRSAIVHGEHIGEDWHLEPHRAEMIAETGDWVRHALTKWIQEPQE